MTADTNVISTDVKESKKPVFSIPDFRKIFPVLGLIAVIAFFQIYTGGKVFTVRNLKAVINEGFFIMIGSVGYVFLLSQGSMDFSIGANMCVSCAAAAMGSAISPVLAIPFGVGTGIIIGALNGFIHVKFKIGALIATLAMQFILNGFVVILLDGGTLQPPLNMLKWNTMTLKITTFLVIVIVGYIVFEYTPYGKRCRAIGSCEEVTKQTGVNYPLMKFIPFVIMGAIAGLLGFFSLIRTGTASSHTGSELMMNVLNAALLGGIPISGGATSKYRAVVIGGLTMAFLTNGMTLMGVGNYDKQLIRGIVFLLAIAISFDRKNMTVIK